MKLKVYVLLAVFTAAMLCTACASAKSSEDYRVIKNAVTGSLSEKPAEELWLHVSVKEKGVETVRVSVPFILVKFLLKKKPDTGIIIHGDKDTGDRIKLIDLVKMLEKAGTNSLVEVQKYEKNEEVKVWIGDEDSCLDKE